MNKIIQSLPPLQDQNAIMFFFQTISLLEIIYFEEINVLKMLKLVDGQ